MNDYGGVRDGRRVRCFVKGRAGEYKVGRLERAGNNEQQGDRSAHDLMVAAMCTKIGF
jgi:hypothetical protein